MRKIANILVVMLWAVNSCLWSATKLSPEEHQYVTFWGQAGYSTLLSSSSAVKPGFGISPAVGVGYRYSRNGFLMQVGVEGQYNNLSLQVNNSDFSLKMRDTEGEAFVMQTHINKDKDIMQAIHLSIPVMVGYEYRHFYMMAGASVSLCVYGTARSEASLALSGHYVEFIDPFEDMPNHQFQSDLQVKSETYKVRWHSPSVNVHAEIGARVDEFWPKRNNEDPKPKTRVYVGAYAEYGLLNVRPINVLGETLSYTQEPGQPLSFAVTPALVSKQLEETPVFPLVVGIKATVLWELPKKKNCVICKD